MRIYTWHFLAQSIHRNLVVISCACLRCLGMKHDWSDGAIVLLAQTRLCFMNFILMTKYTLSIEFVPAQGRGNNHWRAPVRYD